MNFTRHPPGNFSDCNMSLDGEWRTAETPITSKSIKRIILELHLIRFAIEERHTNQTQIHSIGAVVHFATSGINSRSFLFFENTHVLEKFFLSQIWRLVRCERASFDCFPRKSTKKQTACLQVDTHCEWPLVYCLHSYRSSSKRTYKVMIERKKIEDLKRSFIREHKKNQNKRIFISFFKKERDFRIFAC